MLIPRRTFVAWTVLAVTALRIPALALGMCAQASKTPAGDPTCAHALPPQAWLVVGLLVATGGAMLLRPPVLALVPAIGALATTLLFVMSIGLLLPHGVVAVATAGAWARRRRQTPARPAPTS